MEIYIKHSGSTAQDMMIDYTINNDNTVDIKVDHFDSDLMRSFFVDILGNRCGVNAICDDRAEWNPPAPPYKVYMLMAGVKYLVEAHYLVLGGFTVVLRSV